MLLLLTKKYELLDPTLYGSKTWGTGHQESIVRKRKYWYFEDWSASNYEGESSLYQSKINVAVETTDINDVLIYLHKKKVSKDIIRNVLDQYRKIVDTYIEWELFCLDYGNKVK